MTPASPTASAQDSRCSRGRRRSSPARDPAQPPARMAGTPEAMRSSDEPHDAERAAAGTGDHHARRGSTPPRPGEPELTLKTARAADGATISKTPVMMAHAASEMKRTAPARGTERETPATMTPTPRVKHHLSRRGADAPMRPVRRRKAHAPNRRRGTASPSRGKKARRERDANDAAYDEGPHHRASPRCGDSELMVELVLRSVTCAASLWMRGCHARATARGRRNPATACRRRLVRGRRLR